MRPILLNVSVAADGKPFMSFRAQFDSDGNDGRTSVSYSNDTAPDATADSTTPHTNGSQATPHQARQGAHHDGGTPHARHHEGADPADHSRRQRAVHHMEQESGHKGASLADHSRKQREMHAHGDAGGMRPEFKAKLDRFFAAAEADHNHLFIKSGYRSQAHQDRLFAHSDRSGHMVARHSRHTMGIAADLGGDLAWAHKHAHEYGLHFPMPWENWHIEPEGSRGRGATPMAAASPASPRSPTSGGNKPDRNLNPGDLAASPWTLRQPGASESTDTDTGHHLATFDTAEHGWQAMETLARNKYNRFKSINEIIATGEGDPKHTGAWTPGSLGPSAARNIARDMKIDPHEDAGLDDPVRMHAFKRALAIQEGSPQSLIDTLGPAPTADKEASK